MTKGLPTKVLFVVIFILWMILILHLREFVDVESTIDRLMYVYHYLDSSNNLVFRYDNTGHHKKLNLPTYPHHKHQGSEDNVIASQAPDLPAVLDEIETMIHLR